MAPIRKTTKRSTGPTSYPTPTAAFSTTKKDKQAIKHSILLSKISKSAPKSQTKRRRPNKKLVATLESLADALPDYDAEEDGEQGVKEVGQARVVKRSGETTQSLGSGRGLAKRKAKIEKVERERMGLNLAAMATATTAATGASEGGGVQDRWAALRRHVESNMEKKKEFVAG